MTGWSSCTRTTLATVLRNISDDVIRMWQESPESRYTALRHINLESSDGRLSRFEQIRAGENAAETARIVGA